MGRMDKVDKRDGVDKMNRADKASRPLSPPSPLRPSRPLRPFLLHLALMAGAILFTLLLGEAAVRLFRPQNPVALMYSDDPQFGFWNLSNLKHKRVRSERNCPFYHITTDAGGYRGARPVAVPKPAGTLRILVLGDSFTFGVGVEDDQTCPAQMERPLNPADALGASPATARPVEVVNAGCPGWGTENALAFWRARAEQLNPDLLILAFYRNDLNDNLRHLVYQLDNGKAVYAPKKGFARMKRLSRMIPFYDFLSEHSHLLTLARRAISAYMTRPEPLPPSPAPPAKPPHPETSSGQPGAASPAAESPSPTGEDLVPSPVPGNPPVYAWVAHEFASFIPLMESLMEDARTRRVPLLLVLIPDKSDCGENPSVQYVESQRLAEYWAREGKLHLLDLRKPLLESPGGFDDLYVPRDGHFTVKGNRLAAEEVARAARGLIPE